MGTAPHPVGYWLYGAPGFAAAEKHVGRIFDKLRLPQSDSDHRRVLAVLAYLNEAG